VRLCLIFFREGTLGDVGPIRSASRIQAKAMVALGAMFLGACGGTGSLVFPADALDGSTGSGSDAGVVSDGQHAIACGNTTCMAPGQVCCVSANANPASYACISGPTCPVVTVADSGTPSAAGLACSGPADCPPNQVCCIYEPSGANQFVAQCVSSCGVAGEAQLCDPSAPPAQSGCPASAPCSNSNIGDWDLPSTFGTCGGLGN
jgi:hypothetical protein